MIIKRISLFKSKQFEFFIYIPLIWQIAVISWTLATGIFPYYYKYLSGFKYWWMAVAGSAAMVSSVLIRELFLILVMEKLNLPLNGHTLFLFGVVNDIEIGRGKKKEELFAALSGPLFYLIMASVIHCLLVIGQSLKFPLEVLGIIEFVRMINFALGIINIFPIMPLDGGKIVLVVISIFNNNAKKIVNFLMEISSVISMLTVTSGIFICLKGYFQGGLWWILFGMYLHEGSVLLNRKYLIQEMLKMEKAELIMTRNPVSLSKDLSVFKFIKYYLLHFHYKIFPVMDDEKRLHGVLLSRNVFNIAQNDWADYTVGEMATQQLSEVTVNLNTDVLSILEHMYSSGQSRVVVIDNEKKIHGVIVLKDLLKYLSNKMKL